MAKDRGKLPRVAWVLTLGALVTLGACGPRVRPDMPFPEEPVTRRERAPRPPQGGRQVVVGELCPRGAAGRPAVAPLLMRTTQWTDTPTELANAQRYIRKHAGRRALLAMKLLLTAVSLRAMILSGCAALVPGTHRAGARFGFWRAWHAMGALLAPRRAAA